MYMLIDGYILENNQTVSTTTLLNHEKFIVVTYTWS